MNERLKLIREALNLKQYEMADLLGYSRPTYCLLENGKQNINDKHINFICAKFNVNKDWFISGVGDMFDHDKKNEELVKKFAQLDDATQDIILDFVETLLTRQDEEE